MIDHPSAKVKRHPLLMRAQLVRATFADLKTVTRRLDMRWLQAKPGDLIWVKETWAAGRGYDGLKPTEIKPTFVKIHYLADGEKPPWAGKTRVSLFLQERFARLWLEVVSLRKEPLHQITEDDARREGMQEENGVWLGFLDEVSGKWTVHGTARDAFRDLWWSINGQKPCARWEANPYVVRIEFRRVERPGAREASHG